MSRLIWLDRLFSLSLYLYPREFRQQFGEEMREVFHQQCQHQHNRLRLIGELLLDNLRAVPTEHSRMFAQRGMTRFQTLMLLTMVSVVTYGAFIYSLGGPARTYETMKSIATRTATDVSNLPLVLAIRASNEHRYQRARNMLDSDDRRERLTAALMLGDVTIGPPVVWYGNVRPKPNPELDARIDAVIAEAAGHATDAVELQMAARVCSLLVTCDLRPISSKLISIDESNAVSWLYHAEAFRQRQPEKAVEALQMAASAPSYRGIGAAPLRTWLEAVLRDPFRQSWFQSNDHRLQDWAETPVNMMALVRTPKAACAKPNLAPEACTELAERWRRDADSATERKSWLLALVDNDRQRLRRLNAAFTRDQLAILSLDEALLQGTMDMSELLRRLEQTNDVVAVAEQVMAVAPCDPKGDCGEPDLPWHIKGVQQVARPLQPVQ